MANISQSFADGLRNRVMERRAVILQRVEQTRTALKGFRSHHEATIADLQVRARQMRENLAAQREARKQSNDSDRQTRTKEREQRRIHVSELRSEVYNRLGRYRMERHDRAHAMHEQLAGELGAIRDEVQRLRETANSVRSEAKQAFKERVGSELDALKDMTAEICGTTRRSLHEFNEMRASVSHDLFGAITEGVKEVAAAVEEACKPDQPQQAEPPQQAHDEAAEGENPQAHEAQSDQQAQHDQETEPEQHEASQESDTVHPSSEFDEDDLYSVIAEHPNGIGLVDIGTVLKTEWRGLIGMARALLESGRVEKRDNHYFLK